MTKICKLLPIVLAFLISASVLTIRAADQGGQGTPKYGGTLVRIGPGDPTSLNPDISSGNGYLTFELYSSLVTLDMNLHWQPDLADSWDISADGMRWTFHIVHNATWHDGIPLTSADIKFTYEEVIAEFSPQSGEWASLDRVDTPDDYTAVIRWKAPNPSMMQMLGYGYVGGVIIPKHIYENDTTLEDLLTNPATTTHPIGSGPFMFQEYVKGDHLTYVANPNYYRDGPYLSKMVIKLAPEMTTAAGQFEARGSSMLEADVFLPERFNTYAANPDMRTWSVGSLGEAVCWLYMNERNPILNNTKVRQAIAYAINRTAVKNLAWYGASPIPSTILCDDQFGFNNSGCIIYDCDPQKANTLLDEAGFPRGSDGKRFTVDLLYDYGKFDYQKSAEIVFSNLADVGIDVLQRPVDKATHFSTFGAWDFDLAFMRPGMGPDPSVATVILTTANEGHSYHSNTIGYSNSSFDQLHTLAATEMNQTKRAEYFHQLQIIASQDCPVLPMYEVPLLTAMWDEFDGVDTDGKAGLMNDAVMQDIGRWIYWTEGSTMTAAGTEKVISDAELKIQGWSSQFYDVSQALKKLAEARTTYNPDDPATWAETQSLAKEAENAVTPPYLLYAAIASGWIVAIILGVLMLRYRKRK